MRHPAKIWIVVFVIGIIILLGVGAAILLNILAHLQGFLGLCEATAIIGDILAGVADTNGKADVIFLTHLLGQVLKPCFQAGAVEIFEERNDAGEQVFVLIEDGAGVIILNAAANNAANTLIGSL